MVRSRCRIVAMLELRSGIDGGNLVVAQIQLPIAELRVPGGRMGRVGETYLVDARIRPLVRSAPHSPAFVANLAMLQSSMSTTALPIRTRASSIPAPPARPARSLPLIEGPASETAEQGRGANGRVLGRAASDVRGESERACCLLTHR